MKSANLCWGQRYMWLRFHQLPPRHRRETHVVLRFDLPPGLTVAACRAMLTYLTAHPEKGLLGHQSAGLSTVVIQYWRSFEQLEAYARNRDAAHWPAWVAFNKRIGSNGDVGIWHETYLIPAGSYECVYNNMPSIGLGEATRLVPAAGRKATAASRAGVRDEPYPDGAPTEGIEV